MFENWPIEVNPLFIQYENLGENLDNGLTAILNYLRVKRSGYEEAYAKRQNPADLRRKIINYNEIDRKLLERKLDLPNLFQTAMRHQFKHLPADIGEMVPNREPLAPTAGIAYRVGSPYMSKNGVQNVLDALDAGSVSSAGIWPQKMSAFLRQMYNVPSAQPCCNGFASLMLALQAAEVSVGDDVIVPAWTMVAVPNAVSYLGANPLFVDNAPKRSYNPSWVEIEAAATERTKAVIVAHTYAVPCTDLEEIAAGCRRRHWTFIEDISECVGVKSAEGRPLGTYGDFACASMYANKIVHGADAGFVIAKRPEMAARLASICNHGFTKSYHFLHFEKSPNFKINGLGAALALGCLQDVEMVMEHRSALAKEYRKLLADVPLELQPSCGLEDAPWVFGVHCRSKSERTALRQHLMQLGIETRDYFFPLHLQPAYQNDKTQLGQFPVAEELSQIGVYLPIHTDLNAEDVHYIVAAIKKFFNKTVVLPNITKKPPVSCLRINQDTLETTIRKFGPSGKLASSIKNGTLYEAFTLRLALDEWLTNQNWDEGQILLEQIKCIQPKILKHLELAEIFADFQKYIENSFPEDRFLTKYQDQNNFTEVLQKVVLSENPKVVLDMNCWQGKNSIFIAKTLEKYSPKIIAVDTFKWKPYMCEYAEEKHMFWELGFYHSFLENSEYRSKVTPLIFDDPATFISDMKTILKIDSVDFFIWNLKGKTSDELAQNWQTLNEFVEGGKSSICFTNIDSTHLRFLNNLNQNFEDICRSKSCRVVRAKLKKTLKISVTDDNEERQPEEHLLPRKVFVEEDPGWEHQNGAFSQVVNAIRERFHDDTAECIFIPAIEQYICDHPAPLQKPWVGIIHSIEEHKEHFYVPDLQRLCTDRYEPYFANCKGLLTLTSFQKEYLENNLNLKLKIPIEAITYPIAKTENKIKGTTLVEKLHNNGKKINAVMIGSFARDFDYFQKVKLPLFLQKQVLCGDGEVQNWIQKNSITDIQVLPRATAEEYENLLQNSLIFLALKYNGAANTLVLECIERNCPIVLPNISACVDYIGRDYPLLYDPNDTNLCHLITPDQIMKAADYLAKMDKSKFEMKKMLADIENGLVFSSLPPMKPCRFDVTISLCSYKRTHNLDEILNRLWNQQDFNGSIEIIVWNNNVHRQKSVTAICQKYVAENSSKRSLKLITSSHNYHCIVRMAMAQLMNSDHLLICDDDVMPGRQFVSFFLQNSHRHPRDVLCLRGHYFLPHQLAKQHPENVFIDYEHVRFADDSESMRSIHFVHADACLIPKTALMELASVEMPETDMVLVDDYWMSFALSHYFKRNLRKLSVASMNEGAVVTRTEDSDDPKIAMYKRRDVWDARIRMYIHHMLQVSDLLQYYIDDLALLKNCYF